MKKRGFVDKALIAAAGLTAAIAAAPTPTNEPATTKAPPTWADVSPIFQNNCATCHTGPQASGGLALDTYKGIKKGGSSGSVLKPGNAKASLLIKRVHGTIKPRMPLGGDPLPTSQRSKIEAWIDAGATEGKPNQKTQSKPQQPALPKPGASVLYKHVQQIFAQRCVMCHVDGGKMGPAPEGLRLDSYRNVLSTGERANVIPGNPQASRLVRLVKGLESPRMPLNGPPLTQEQLRVISDWISQGARDNASKRGPMPVGVEVRFEGTLTRFWVVDGVTVNADDARIDKNPRPGDFVEIRGVVSSDGSIRATRIRRR